MLPWAGSPGLPPTLVDLALARRERRTLTLISRHGDLDLDVDVVCSPRPRPLRPGRPGGWLKCGQCLQRRAVANTGQVRMSEVPEWSLCTASELGLRAGDILSGPCGRELCACRLGEDGSA